MGSVVMIGHDTKEMSDIRSQVLQSACRNGTLSDTKDINVTDCMAKINRPHLVDDSSTNGPENLLYGIREVFFYDTQHVVLQITGLTKDDRVNIWFCNGYLSNGEFSLTDWITLHEMEETPKIDDAGLSLVNTWSSQKINSEIARDWDYTILRGNTTTLTITDTSQSMLPINTCKAKTGNIDAYVTALENGLISIKPGTYIIGGKVQVTSSEEPTNVLVTWYVGDATTYVFETCAESQASEGYAYIASGTVQAKIPINQVIFTVTKDSLIEFYVKSNVATNLVISPEACRIQITKIH